jgi:hypothetical protein
MNYLTEPHSARLVTFWNRPDVDGRPKDDRFRVEDTAPGQIGVLILKSFGSDVLFWLNHSEPTQELRFGHFRFISPRTTPDYFRYPRSAFRRS